MDLVVSCPIELTDGGVAIQIDSEEVIREDSSMCQIYLEFCEVQFNKFLVISHFESG